VPLLLVVPDAEVVLSIPVPVVPVVPVDAVCDAVVPVPAAPLIPVLVLPEVDPELRVELQDSASAKGNTKNNFFIGLTFNNTKPNYYARGT